MINLLQIALTFIKNYASFFITNCVDFLLQITSALYYKLRQFYYKLRQTFKTLLQIVSVLQITPALLLQIASV